MPLSFKKLCDLLSALENICAQDPPLLRDRRYRKCHETITSWFIQYRVSINSSNLDPVALLSALFPAKRTDRVYNIQLPRLTSILKRCLCLGKVRAEILDQWNIPGRGSLGECVERALIQAEFPEQPPRNCVTLEQVDGALAQIAQKCRFSGPKVRALQVRNDQEVLEILTNLYQRMQSREAKWFTRMILKDYSCLDIDENIVYYAMDSRLRVAMQMYNDFESAITELNLLPSSQLINSNHCGWTQQCTNDANLLPPRLGVKVGPPRWVKAKGGVRHALTIIDQRTMSVERKHDGEYCQIHVDLSKGEDCIQIFSKSGKDSTIDRAGIHQAIKDGLGIGTVKCGFSAKCILEGELLVWSKKAKGDGILEFHKIRKHVSRSGSFLGTTLDSQPHPWENLMIMFYDVMLIDDDPVLHESYYTRRRRLEQLITPVKGKADLVEQTHVNFARFTGPEKLKKALAAAFVQRWEGLVVKPSHEPYFNLSRSAKDCYSSRWIKLKKDCIKGLGDTADFAVVGAGYDVSEAGKFPGLKLKWTHFYIGCLRNKSSIAHGKPSFLIIDKVSDCLKKDDLKYLNQHGQFALRELQPGTKEAQEIFDIEIIGGFTKMQIIFRKPFVFEIAGSGFEKAPNRDIFTLRFPRVMKLCHDKDWRHTVSLDELQSMATEAVTAPYMKQDIKEEVAEWIEKLNQLDREPIGRAVTWDNSEGEEVDPALYAKKLSATSMSKSLRRVQTMNVPPLVRMDTGEMQKDERRLGNGDVIGHSAGWKHSVTSVTSNGSLQTPPSTSPLSQDSGNKGDVVSSGSVQKALKRPAEKADIEQTTGIHKRARLPSLKHSRSEPQPHTQKSPDPVRKHLGEINNSASSVLKSLIVKAAQYKRSSISRLPQTEKMPGSEVEEIRGTECSNMMEPPPPTTSIMTENASEIISHPAATQQTSLHNGPSDPTPPVVASIAEGVLMPPPPSRADNPEDDDAEQLRQRHVILSPNLDESHPLRAILASHAVTPLPFPTLSSPLSPNPQDNSNIILIVDSSNSGTCGYYIYRLVKQIPQWHPRTVRVWDWRIVSKMLDGEMRDERRRRSLIRKYFVAKMNWDPEGDGGGAVVLMWNDRRVSRVSRRELDELRG